MQIKQLVINKMAQIKELTSNEFSKLISNDNLGVVDFYAEWCMPCLMMAPVFEGIAEKTKNIDFGKVNIEESEKLAKEYNVSSIPCLIFFKSGKEVDRIIGSVSEEIIEDKINNLR